MSRQLDALAVLRAWQAPSAPQEALRERYLHHLAQHDDGTERGCFPDHLTAGTLVLDATGRHVLLNLHRKAGRWFAFGGHGELGDATLADIARREALEESGIEDLRFDPVPLQLNEHAVDFCDARGTVHHLDVRYGALAPPGAVARVSEESLDVRWWPIEALPDLEDEMVQLIELARGRLLAI